MKRHASPNKDRPADSRSNRGASNRTRKIFGLVAKVKNGFMVEPIERGARASFDLQPVDKDVDYPGDYPGAYQAGDMIEAEVSNNRGHGRKTAKMLKNLGAADGIDAFSALTIAEFDLRHDFAADVIANADAGQPIELGGREDLRPLPLVTIDGADARDFDDAVFAEPHTGGGYRIIVAIADVAAYVEAGSPLDIEAAKRGNSVYFPDRVIPMLPEVLSNGLCSLVPKQDRACLGVEVIIDADGVKTSHRFFRGLMQSHARLTYDRVDAYLDKPDEGAGEKSELGIDTGHLDALYGAYKLRAKQRKKRGALDLDLPDKKVILDDDGRPCKMMVQYQTTAQKIIEEMMILANIAAAETLQGAKRLCFFRAHERPDPAKIDTLSDLAKQLGQVLRKGQVITSHHFNDLLKKVKEAGDPAAMLMVNNAVLRCQSQADYRLTNPGHFGLALRHYAHFTSPIRRYADLLVHRSLLNHLANNDAIKLPNQDNAAELAQTISDLERQAAAAERRCTDRFAIKLLEDKSGQVIDGTVTTITSFGAFVRLTDTGEEGLLPLRLLPDDYYHVDTGKGVITASSSKIKIAAGDTLSVLVTAVEPLKASITLGWVGDAAPKKKSAKKPKKKFAKKRRP